MEVLVVLLGLLVIAVCSVYLFGRSLRDIHRRAERTGERRPTGFLTRQVALNVLPSLAVLALGAFLRARASAIDVDVVDFLTGLLPVALGGTIVLALGVVGYGLVATLRPGPPGGRRPDQHTSPSPAGTGS